MSYYFFSSQALNFSSEETGVDPRTGDFRTVIPLVDLQIGQTGPAISLALRYTMLATFFWPEDTYGIGCTLPVSQFNPRLNELMLSSGEMYSLRADGPKLIQGKPVSFKLERYGDYIKIFYESGLVEVLQKFDRYYTLIEQIAENERKVTYTWDRYGVELQEIRDDNNLKICAFTYDLKKTTLNVYKHDGTINNSIQFNYSFYKGRRYVDSFEFSAPGFESLKTTFEYIIYKEHREKFLSKIVYPTGSYEEIEYNQKGILFPSVSALSPYPRVSRHYIYPGAGQPGSKTTWTWSDKNFLGKGAGLTQWHRQDNLVEARLTDFFYKSVVKTSSTDSDKVLKTVTRTYNSFHLLVKEKTSRDGKSHVTEYKHRANNNNLAYHEQPDRYTSVDRITETWQDDNGEKYSQQTLRTYDELGNLLSQKDPDGTVTQFSYYPAAGETVSDEHGTQSVLCPPDPRGVVRYLKSKKVIPPIRTGAEVPVITEYFWTRIDNLLDYYVAQDRQIETVGKMKTDVRMEYIRSTSNFMTYSRIKTITTTRTPNIDAPESYTSVLSCDYLHVDEKMTQTNTIKGYDGQTCTYTTVTDWRLGHILSETNTQGVKTDYTYDALGRVLSRTVDPGGPNQRKNSWAYKITGGVAETVETDPAGNQYLIGYDGAGREIVRKHFDVDVTQAWFEVFSQKHSVLGELDSSVSADRTTNNVSVARRMDCSFDGWGNLSKQKLSHGVTNLQNINPVTFTRTLSAVADNGQKTGELKTVYDGKYRVPKKSVITDASGKQQGERLYDWDGMRRLTYSTDELGNKVIYSRDELGRVVTARLPDNTEIFYTYAPHLIGNQIASIAVKGDNGFGTTTRWVLGTQRFDSLGRVTQRISYGRETRYEYTGASPEPSMVRLPSGEEVEYTTIPTLGNAVSKITSRSASFRQTFEYSPLTGFLVKAVEDRREIINTYNSFGTLKMESFEQGEGSVLSESTLMLSGETDTYIDVNRQEITRKLDAYGRVTEITYPDMSVTLTYTALGPVGSSLVKHSSGTTVRTELSYDDFGRETLRKVEDKAGTLKVTQTWRIDGLLATRKKTLETKTEPEKEDVLSHEQFEYDSRKRLVKYAVSGSKLPKDGFAKEFTQQKYTFDALNNIRVVVTTLLDGTENTATYIYSESDPTQVSTITHNHPQYPKSVVLKYNANGQMTEDGSGRIFDYDVLGRLISVRPSDGIERTYKYDALNRLVSHEDDHRDRRVRYYRNDEQVCENLFSFIPGGNKNISLLKQGHTCLALNEGTHFRLMATDNHGSQLSAGLTDQDTVTQYVWSPYGSGRTTKWAPGFNGERADPLTGCYHLGNGYRAYNPMLMRFNCPDDTSPFGAGGLNPYTYCDGDPVNNTDPSGQVSAGRFGGRGGGRGGGRSGGRSGGRGSYVVRELEVNNQNMGLWTKVGLMMGIIGLVALVVSGMVAVAAAGGIALAVSSMSVGEMVGVGLAVTSVSTGIASALTELSNPEVSTALSYLSFAAGGLGAFRAFKSVVRFAIQVVKWKALPSTQVLSDLYDVYDFSRSSAFMLMSWLPDNPGENTDDDGERVDFFRSEDEHHSNASQRSISAAAMELLLHEERRNNYAVNEGVRTILSGSVSRGGTISGELATTTRRPVKALRNPIFALFSQDNLFYGALADYYNGTDSSNLTKDM